MQNYCCYCALLVRHAHADRSTQRWRCGVHPQENWHHWHKVSTTESHAICAAVTLCNRNLLHSASLPPYDKTDRRQQAVCPIRRALRPDPDLQRNSHSSTPQVSLSLQHMYTQTHTNTQQQSWLCLRFLTWTHKSVWAVLTGLKGPHCQAERFNNIDKHRSRSINLGGKHLLSSSVAL